MAPKKGKGKPEGGDDKKQTKDKPAPWPPVPVAGAAAKPKDAADAAAPAAAAAAAAPKAATTSMKVPKKAEATPPLNDLKEEDMDRQKLESAMRRRQQLQKGEPATAKAANFAIDSNIAKQQREKQREWIASSERELEELREVSKKESEKNSDRALKVVILVWVLIILGIFFHVYRTIEAGTRGAAANAAVRNPNRADGSWAPNV